MRHKSRQQVQLRCLEIKPVLKAPRETPLPSRLQPRGRMKGGKIKKKCGPMTHAKHQLKEDFPRIKQRGCFERKCRFLCKINAHKEALPAHPHGLLEHDAPVAAAAFWLLVE